MKKVYCDIRNCGEEAVVEQVDVCFGYRTSEESANIKKIFKPFEKPTMSKGDLCKKHYRKWCKVIYEAFYGKAK